MSAYRRDRNVKFDSVIAGLRFERDAAQALCTFAIDHAADERGVGNVAEVVRYLVRTGLGASGEEANRIEATGGFRQCGIAGLQLDVPTVRQLDAFTKANRWGKAAAARHLVRLGLGYPDAESRARENRFAVIAEVRKAEKL